MKLFLVHFFGQQVKIGTDIIYALDRDKADDLFRRTRKLKNLTPISMFEYYSIRYDDNLKKKKVREVGSNLVLISVEECQILLPDDHCIFRARE